MGGGCLVYDSLTGCAFFSLSPFSVWGRSLQGSQTFRASPRKSLHTLEYLVLKFVQEEFIYKTFDGKIPCEHIDLWLDKILTLLPFILKTTQGHSV